MSGGASHKALVPVSVRRRRVIMAGLLLGVSLGAFEATVVSTAMPTLIATLGGLAQYSWVFSAYLLTSTACLPIWGRLSDLHGRRRIYLTGVALFFVGSLLSGISQTIGQFIGARALQGLGAGCILPVSMTVVGELYAMAERPRIQALFSGVWGVASIAGPLIGGYLTDHIDWRWIFLLNLPLAALSGAVIAIAYPPSHRRIAVGVNWLSAILLFTGISALLIAVGRDQGTSLWAWVVVTVVLLRAFVIVDRGSAEPILPLDLFRLKVVVRTQIVAFMVGVALFAALAFIPLFVQAVRGGTATEAGRALTPLFIGWVTMSMVGTRAALRLGYRRVAIAGGAIMTAGFIGLTAVDGDSPPGLLVMSGAMIGAGMGTQMLSLLLAVQHGVDRSRLGVATALNQFCRSVGYTVGIAVMGTILSRGLSGLALPGGHEAFAATNETLTPPLRAQFATALHRVFVSGAIVSAAALLATFFLPSITLTASPPEPALDTVSREKMLTGARG